MLKQVCNQQLNDSAWPRARIKHSAAQQPFVNPPALAVVRVRRIWGTAAVGLIRMAEANKIYPLKGGFEAIARRWRSRSTSETSDGVVSMNN